MAGAIQAAFDSVYADGPISAPSQPVKSRIRNEVGSTLQREVDGIKTIAAGKGNPKAEVRIAFKSNTTLSSVTNGSTHQGVTLATGDRVAFMAQTSGAANGIYVVQASGPPVRASDADTADEVLLMTFTVLEGTYAYDRYISDTPAPIVLGTTPLTFVLDTKSQPPVYASGDEAKAGAVTGKAMSPATNKTVLDTRFPGLAGVDIDVPEIVLAWLDRTGRLGLSIKEDGTGYLSTGKIVTEPTSPAILDIRQRVYVAAYGGDISLNASDSTDPLDTYYAAGDLMMGVGIESFSGSSSGASPATGTIGFNPGGSRERSLVPVMRAMAYGPLAGSRIIADLPGRSGNAAQLTGLNSGTAPFINMVANVNTCVTEAISDGLTCGVGAMFWQGGEQDWRGGYTIADYLNMFTIFDADERAALDSVTKGSPYPRFIRQPSSHSRWTDLVHALNVTVALGRAGQIPNNFVVGPDYMCQHVDGAAYGWNLTPRLSPDGLRHAGMYDAKAWLRWAMTGKWRPCEMTKARLYGRKIIEVLVHVPVPPLQISTTTCAEVADGNHGLEVWIGSTRYDIESVSIADDGAASHEGRIVIVMEDDLPAGTPEVWASRTDDATGTSAGEYYTGRQPGPLTGPRTTICDSDTVALEPWANAMLNLAGQPYDLRNYLRIDGIIAQ